MDTDFAQERREAARHVTSIRGTLNCSRGTRVTVSIADLSVSGFNAEGGYWPAAGDERGFSVKVPGLEALGAELRWTDEESAGFRFAQPLHSAVLDHVVRAFPPKPDDAKG